jgi:hypothetical protein
MESVPTLIGKDTEKATEICGGGGGQRAVRTKDQPGR